MSETATIRVPVVARDNFARVANARQQSISSYLVGLSREVLRQALVDAEREATAQDAQNPAAREEYALWEGTLSDGIE